MPVEIARLSTANADFADRFAALLDRAPEADTVVAARTAEIVEAVRSRGDAVLVDYTNRFDRRSVADASALELPKAALAAAWNSLDASLKAALEAAAARIRAYAERQKIAEWSFEDEHGNTLGQRVTPLDRAGLYVPGGKAAYPSSVLIDRKSVV
jgi:histidinol dehydrogenase